LRPQNP